MRKQQEQIMNDETMNLHAEECDPNMWKWGLDNGDNGHK